MAKKRATRSGRRTGTKKPAAAARTTRRASGTAVRTAATVRKAVKPVNKHVKQTTIVPRARSRALAAAPSLDVKGSVLRALKNISTCAPGDVTLCMDLRIDLCFTDDLKRALAAPLQTIARQGNAGATISRNECAGLGSVEDAVVLVATKAGLAHQRTCA